jgi:ketosteroid isomerase-like protein
MKRATAACLRFILAIICSHVMVVTVCADELDDVMTASRAAYTTLKKALISEEGALLASVFTEDATVAAPNGTSISGRLTIRTTATLLFMTKGGGKLTVTSDSLLAIDSLNAYRENGRYTFSQHSGKDQTRQFTGRFETLWTKEDNFWKIASLVGRRISAKKQPQ